MYEAIQNREVDEGNRLYTIVKAGTSAAHKKSSPDKIFSKDRGSGEIQPGEYVNFAKRRQKLLEKKREKEKQKEIKLSWGKPPDNND